MLVRLAFSVMMQVDADILLIDEVLAVGDAAFQQKCADAFHEMKAAGKTIVLVTHEMATVEAVLPPGDADRRRPDPAHRRPGRGRRAATCGSTSSAAATSGAALDRGGERRTVRLLDAWHRGRATASGSATVEHGETIRHPGRARSAARRRRRSASASPIANADGVGVFQFGAADRAATAPPPTRGRRARQGRGRVENLLGAGPLLRPLRGQPRLDGGVALYVHDAIDFVVFGGDPPTAGSSPSPHEVEATSSAEGRA